MKAATHGMTQQLNREMKLLKITIEIVILFIFSYSGNYLHTAFNLPIPGSIIGMLLLLMGLSLNIVPVDWIEDGASILLAFLPMLFIPVFIGVMNYPSLFSVQGGILFLIIIGSTMITIIASGSISQLFIRYTHKNRKDTKGWSK